VAWESIRSSYDAVARPYERQFLHELDEKPMDRELLAWLASVAKDPVLDIGCGPGQIGAAVAASSRVVIGVDFSREMARLAATRLDAAVAADMRALPLGAAVAGGVVAFYSLIHLRRRELGAALQEFHRVLRPGGWMLISAHEGTGEIERDEFVGEPVPMAATFFRLEELATATTEAGFEIIRAERRLPYPSEAQFPRLYVAARR
jgi:ubiquinone/menaquinone biosynthesis C-methylase UbiE